MRTLLMVVVGISAITLMTQVRGEDPKPPAQRVGVTSSELFLGAVPRAGDTEVTVLDVTYLPGAINPRHFHPAAVAFHVISGTPVFQEATGRWSP